MSGDVLRRAARLMRLNAEEADDGFPWRAGGSYVDTDPECGFNAGTSLIADHVASWHPAVALAVADWLDWVADAVVAIDGLADLSERLDLLHKTSRERSEAFAACEQHALAVASAYLGEGTC